MAVAPLAWYEPVVLVVGAAYVVRTAAARVAPVEMAGLAALLEPLALAALVGLLVHAVHLAVCGAGRVARAPHARAFGAACAVAAAAAASGAASAHGSGAGPPAAERTPRLRARIRGGAPFPRPRGWFRGAQASTSWPGSAASPLRCRRTHIDGQSVSACKTRKQGGRGHIWTCACGILDTRPPAGAVCERLRSCHKFTAGQGGRKVRAWDFDFLQARRVYLARERVTLGIVFSSGLRWLISYVHA